MHPHPTGHLDLNFPHKESHKQAKVRTPKTNQQKKSLNTVRTQIKYQQKDTLQKHTRLNSGVPKEDPQKKMRTELRRKGYVLSIIESAQHSAARRYNSKRDEEHVSGVSNRMRRQR